MRDEWTVTYEASVLLKAAQEKIAFHEGRRDWWRSKKDEVIEKIKAEGISVTETIVDELSKGGYGTSNLARGGPVVQIDHGMAAQVQEATQKVHEHDSKIREYRSWAEMLGAGKTQQHHTVYEVDHGDWLFFFGK